MSAEPSVPQSPEPAQRALTTAPAPLPAVPDEGSRIARFPLRFAAASRQERRMRLSPGLLSFLLMVALPVLAASVYYSFIAADQYVVEMRFAVRSVAPVRSDASALFHGSVATSQLGLDSNIVVQYIRSRAIVDDIDKSLDLREIFSRRRADWLSRLELPVPIEKLVRYWKGQVDAYFDNTDGTIVVKVRAFTPNDALAVARAIVRSSEDLVNTLSQRARRATIRQSERDVETAEKRLSAALARLRKFRDKEGVIDPRIAAAKTLALVQKLRGERIAAEAQLATMRRYLDNDAPSIRLIETRIASFAAQEKALAAQLTGGSGSPGRALSAVMGSYAQLESERSFAETAYQHALAALDRSRRDALRRQIYLADFVAPSLPQEALYPHRLRMVGIVLLIAFALWAIGGLALQSVRDHL